MSKKENGYEMIVNNRELMAMFERVAGANGRTGEEVLATFIKDYIVSGGRPELVDDSRS